MASGNASLVLTELVRHEEFPKYAHALVDLLGGSIQTEANSAAERVWSVTIDGALFWLSWEDYPPGVSLDARDSKASKMLPAIRERLLAGRRTTL